MEVVFAPPKTDLGYGLPAKEVRTEQARNLGAIMKWQAEPIDSELGPDFTRDMRFNHAYGRLGERLFIGFGRQALSKGDEKLIRLGERPAVLHGCYVLAKLISYGPGAYADYLQTNPETTASLIDFTDIMKRSKDTYEAFADTDKKSNTTLEMSFGLLQYPPMYDDLPPFLIQPNKQGELEFKESPIIVERAKRELLRQLPEGEAPKLKVPGDIYCPAVGMVLSSLWETGIEGAASDPQLFASDFARLGVPIATVEQL